MNVVSSLSKVEDWGYIFEYIDFRRSKPTENWLKTDKCKQKEGNKLCNIVNVWDGQTC